MRRPGKGRGGGYVVTDVAVKNRIWRGSAGAAGEAGSAAASAWATAGNTW